MSEIIYNTTKLKEGIDEIANAVKITIGPKGKNVIIDRGYPLVSNDGGTIAQAISFKDKTKNMGALLIKAVIQKTSERAGGGRTASAILVQELVSKGLVYSAMGLDMNQMKEGMLEAKDDVIKKLKEMAKKITTTKEVQQVATISTESEELGKVIAQTIEKIGKDGIVQVEEGQTFGITTEFTDGLEFDKGYVSPFMITNPERMEAEYKNPPIYITDKKINTYKEIYPVIADVESKKANSLVVIADDFSEDTLRNFIIMKLKGVMNILAIKAPGYGDNKNTILEDLAELIGAKMQMGDEYKLGTCEKIISTKDTTTIMKGAGNLNEYLASLHIQRNITENKMEQDRLDERIAKLSNKIAIIRVGTASDTKLNYLKQKVEDGVNEAKRALEDGIVIGGNCVFIHAKNELKEKRSMKEFDLGYNMVLDSIEAPLRQIILNSKGKPDVIINELKDKLYVYGYDARIDKVVEDMFDKGIIDAVKVPITILENAIDEVSTFLTLGASINEENENIQSK